MHMHYSKKNKKIEIAIWQHYVKKMKFYEIKLD